jgi:RND family efflux transporter MFP subunit
MIRPLHLITAALLLTSPLASLAQVDSPSTPGTFTADESGALHMRGQAGPAAKVEVPAGMHGQLAEVNVKEGELVTKGQQLARLDDELQRRAVELAKQEAESTVEIRGAQNQVDFAKNELARIQKVDAGGPSSAENRQKELSLKQSELGLEFKKSEQQQNLTKLQREQLVLDRMTIRSPIDGYVLRVNKQVGEETDDNPLIVIVQTSKLHAVFFPPRPLFGKIREGDSVTLDFSGLARQAKVVAVDPIIEPASQLFRVKLEVDNADAKIPAGTAATWIWHDPQTALRTDP